MLSVLFPNPSRPAYAVALKRDHILRATLSPKIETPRSESNIRPAYAVATGRDPFSV
ncbi:MAG: hypothetical protein IJR99_09900 [Kiritimatiellae bacterium]|nr:hypothetical protein [Kiritimatiellia bacterium]